MTISAAQMRMARACLDMKQDDLADACGMDRSQISNYEKGKRQLSTATIERVETYLTMQGLTFLSNNGVQQGSNTVELKGIEGLKIFMEDIYASIRYGGNLSLYNTQPEIWVEHMTSEWYEMHNARIAAIKQPVTIRNAIKEGNRNYILHGCEYRWIPQENWHDTTFYTYGNKLAFINFSEGEIQITILTDSKIVKAYIQLFKIAWKHNTIPAEGFSV